MKLLSVVFSFRNEESNLIELVKRTSAAIKKLSNWTFELIFVNATAPGYGVDARSVVLNTLLDGSARVLVGRG